MKIAITGGTGFIGRNLAHDLVSRGHEVIIITRGQYSRNTQPIEGATFVSQNINATDKLYDVFRGCEAVVHCAGTSVEDSKQTFQQLHVQGTRSAVIAAERAGVKKFVLVSYLNVRPNVKSEYHTTKWQGEEIVRSSKLNFTILKVGLVYGPGDHLLNNLSNLFRKLPIFAAVGIREKTVRLVAVEDLVEVIRVSLDEDRFARQTIAVLGPEEFPFSQAARRIAKAMGKPFLIVLPFPVFFHRVLAFFSERFMAKPLITKSQVQMLADGISQPTRESIQLPD
ncbi:MAG TPA: NAD-dependent epimerase/dehydratase family protein, partial [Anaerolineales bacterium]|nr:NAD-dependent epimerase/dehydratase family protein [Anaerolineales bacterium]